ncbi:sporulation protein [Bacillus manliponensis]|uniref:sporulation protein n=1 Tax=Bacillus manliponensis TaxID=574376 RepID=UPI0035152CA1
MLKKFLARFGKGAAKVDLRFENRPYISGDTVHGEVHIQGGEVEQKMNHLSVHLMMSVITKEGTVTREVTSIPLLGDGAVSPKELKVIPFTYTIPVNLPVSRHKVSYYFDTQLDIEGGVDRTDIDPLMVEVPEGVQSIFEALGSLGFREKGNSGGLDKYGQEFAFFPAEVFSGKVNEVELRFACEEDGVRVWMEVDCRYGYEEIEVKREFFLENVVLQDEEELVGTLKQYITEAIEKPYVYQKPFSYMSHSSSNGYGSHSHSTSGMIGGLAMGILGGMLLSEMLDLDDMVEDMAEALGFEEEDSAGGEEDGGFFDFFDGGDEG